MAVFYNQATLSYAGTTTASNTVSGELQSGIGITKLSASADYRRGDGITYVVTVTNEGAAPYTSVTLSDNLGAFTPGGSDTAFTPLTYVEDSLLYFVNGVREEAPAASGSGTGLIINGITVPAGSTVTLIYEARVNEYARLSSGSTITNRVALTGNGITDDVSATETVTVRDEAYLTVAKAIYPAVIAEDGMLTYTFIIQNSGNVAADGEALFITDTFTPILRDITVTLDGEPLELNTGYTYDETTGEFATVGGAVTVPAATFTRDPVSGVINVIPGSTVITVSGSAF